MKQAPGLVPPGALQLRLTALFEPLRVTEISPEAADIFEVDADPVSML
jgi:hypothetical protein